MEILDYLERNTFLRLAGMITLLVGGSVVGWVVWVFRRAVPKAIFDKSPTVENPAKEPLLVLNDQDLSGPKLHELKGQLIKVTGIVFLTNTDDRASPYLELRPYPGNGRVHIQCTFPPEDVYRVHRLEGVSLAAVTGVAETGFEFDSIMRPVLHLSDCRVERPATWILLKYQSVFRWW